MTLTKPSKNIFYISVIAAVISVASQFVPELRFVGPWTTFIFGSIAYGSLISGVLFKGV